MSETIVTYKGTDKDMKCYGGYPYEIDKTEKDDGAIRCGSKGFHSCEVPLNTLAYYSPVNGNRYFQAEAGGKIDRTGADDSKLASSELALKAEIGLPGLIKAQIEYVKKKCEDSTQEHASGERGNATASGVRGTAVVTGENGIASAEGEQCLAVAWGRDCVGIGSLGSWITLAEHYADKPGIKRAKLVKVDGKRIKANTLYILKDGKVVEK